MSETIKILIAEDTPSDAELCQREVRKVLKSCLFEVVDSRQAYLAALSKFQPDLILSDYSMPGFDGMSALKLLQEHSPETPFIIVTGSVSEDVAAESMKAGAWDYIIKEHIRRLGPAVINALEKKQTLITKRKAEEEREAAYLALDRALNGTIKAMSKIVEMRDPYTSGHQTRVADLSAAIAGELGLPEANIRYLHIAALIHDIGKIYIPSDILSKPGKLRDIEWELVKIHAQGSYDILKNIEFPWPVDQIAWQHHERLDGSGYPRGLSGDQILQEAKILAVADVVEAMSSHRPYRAALGIEKALDEITQNRGVLYDPDVVDACLKLFKENRFKLEHMQNNSL
jgi:putative two-component system response regulator